MTRGKNTKRRPWPPKKADLEALIEEAIVDAGSRSSAPEILGVAATVERIDMTDDEQIVAICRRGPSRQAIPILDLPLPDPLPAGAEWIEAYRHWARVV